MNESVSRQFDDVELLRMQLSDQPFAARISSAQGSKVAVWLQGRAAPVHLDIVAVNVDWIDATASNDRMLIVPMHAIERIAIESKNPITNSLDRIVQRLRGVLGELGRRRRGVRVNCGDFMVDGRIHHVGLDYVEIAPNGDRAARLVVPIHALSFIEVWER